MDAGEVRAANRVIFTHFDSYSAALLFARWESRLLAPAALPPEVESVAPPTPCRPENEGATVMATMLADYGLNPSEWTRLDDFDAWMRSDTQLIRVHVLRYMGLDAPVRQFEVHGATLKPISALRGSAMLELNLLRQVFNLLVGGAAH